MQEALNLLCNEYPFTERMENILGHMVSRNSGHDRQGNDLIVEDPSFRVEKFVETIGSRQKL